LNTNQSRFKNSNGKESVLVVDDEPDIVNLIKQSLHKKGMKVSAFTDPVMALEDFKVKCKTCSLILSDIRMPGINGYELVKEAKEIDKQIKVILMSAFEINERISQSTARYQGRRLPSKAIFYTAVKSYSRQNQYKFSIDC